MTRKRTPSYGDAVLWLAQNDETAEHDNEIVAGLVTTLLAADLFGVEPSVLADDVIRTRHGAGRWALEDGNPVRCACRDGERG